MKESNSTFRQLGASNRSTYERVRNDYYATDPKAVEMLLDLEQFSPNIWECACGEGHISKVLESRGYTVRSTDLIDRNYGQGGVDFLLQTEIWDGDIITNPPYKYALKFVEKRLELIPDGRRVCMLLRIQFLEGQSRLKLFKRRPFKVMYVSTKRLCCRRNGLFEQFDKKSRMAYAWFIWEKGYTGESIVRWFNG